MDAVITILTRSLVRMRMPLQAFRASSHLEYDSLVLHRDAPNAHGITPQKERESSKQIELCRTIILCRLHSGETRTGQMSLKEFADSVKGSPEDQQ